MAYYIYVEKLHHTEQEFWGASYLKIDFILGEYMNELSAMKGQQSQIEEISSMKDMIGW